MAFGKKYRGQAGLPAEASAQAGQVLLIVILVIIVASTVGLSLVSRTITNLRTSTEEAESQKALAAAEAGIERVLQNSAPVGVSDSLTNNSTYKAEVTQIQSSSFLINGGNPVPKDEGADVWFVPHTANGDINYLDYSSTSPNFLNLYWWSSDEDCNASNKPAAIQAVIVTRDPTLPDSSPDKIKSYRYVYDRCSRGNSFDPAQDNTDNLYIDGQILKYKTPINELTKGIIPVTEKNIILMRVIPIYNDTVVGVYACNNGGQNCTALPTQGYMVTSTGISGEANRKLRVFKSWPQIYLPYLSYGLFVAN